MGKYSHSKKLISHDSNSKHVLADVWVVKSSELGLQDDDGIHCRTFLGAILNIGDICLGLDVSNCNVNNPDMELMSADKIPDVVIVKKIYGSKAQRHGAGDGILNIWKDSHTWTLRALTTTSRTSCRIWRRTRIRGSMSTYTRANMQFLWTRTMTLKLMLLRSVWRRCWMILILERKMLQEGQERKWRNDGYM